MGLFSVTAPAPRNFGNEIGGILGQYGQTAGAQYENAANYNPQYQNLNLGLYGEAIPQLDAILNGANTSARGAALSDLGQYGGAANQAIQAINPQQTDLYNQLVQQAQSGLAAGARLSPDQQYRVSQPIRNDWAGRGFSESLPGQLDQAVALSRSGDAMQAQRQNFAQQVTEQGNRYYTQPAMASILGTGSQAAGAYQQVGAPASNPDTFGGLLGYGSDLYNTNFNSEAAARIATGNNRMAGINGITSAASSY